MSESVVSTLNYSTGFSSVERSERTARIVRNRHNQSGEFYWLKLALNNPYLHLTKKQRLNIKSELHGWLTVNKNTGQHIPVSAGRLSLKYQKNKSKHWFGKFNSASRIFKSLTTGSASKTYKYLLTVNGPELDSDELKQINSKVTRLLKKNRKIGLIFRANGIAPTYQNGKPNLDYHVHFKLFATSRINKRQLVREVNRLAKHLDVDLKKINPDKDKTNAYMSDQQTGYNRKNKNTKLTYFQTFMTYKKQQQKKIQAELYQDRSRPFGIYCNSCNTTGRLTKRTLKTKPKHNLSLFNSKDYDSQPQTTINHHHWSKKELWRHRNGLNIYTGQLLQRTYRQHRAYPVVYHQQLSWNIPELQRLALFDVM